jgi:hypothetical protein
MDDAAKAEISVEIAGAVPPARIQLSDMFLCHGGTNWYAYRDDNGGLELACSTSLVECAFIARKRLQAERDAKDAPKLREENERLLATLKELVEACKDETWHNKNFRKWSDAKQLLKEVSP